MHTLFDQTDEPKKFLKKILIYGEPSSGKTTLAATAALSPYLERIFWFDCDRSIETLHYLPWLTDEAKKKIIPFTLTGSMEHPVAAQTLLNGFTSKKQKQLCYKHSMIGCKEIGCASIPWSLYSLTEKDCVVIDPGSKIAELLFGLVSTLNDTQNKQQWWGDFYVKMDDVQSALLDCPTNVIWTSHEMDLTKTVNKGTKDEREVVVRTVPICGSRNYSKKFSRDFGYKIVTYTDGSRFKATTKPGEYGKAIVGHRRPVSLYNDQNQPTLIHVFDPDAQTQVVEQSTFSLKPRIK